MQPSYRQSTLFVFVEVIALDESQGTLLGACLQLDLWHLGRSSPINLTFVARYTLYDGHDVALGFVCGAFPWSFKSSPVPLGYVVEYHYRSRSPPLLTQCFEKNGAMLYPTVLSSARTKPPCSVEYEM
jgi:hypothetical protein